jgi:hypothetical protein
MTDLNVEAHGERIIVTEPETGFYAIYEKRGDAPQLILKGRAETKDHVLLARVWHVAVDKARELGWIV